jgi:hypothetical protein
MGIQVQGNGGTIADVGGTTFRGLNTHAKPLEYGALGHYRTSVRISSTAAQAANSRIFEIRNTHATNLIIPTRLTLRAIQTAAGTLQENSLDIYKVTTFTAVDTTNTVTPVSSVKRTSMAAYPGGAAVRHLTLAGNAAGMTGGTLTKDTQFFSTFPYMVTAGLATATFTPPPWGPLDVLDDVNGTHPFVFVQNEGLIIENRVLNVTSMGITWYIDFSWAEVTAF